MLRLADADVAALDAAEVREFLARMTDEYIADRPGEAPAREVVAARMQAAYGKALDIGFTDGPHIVRFMRLMCDAPPLFGDAHFEAYLRKPGATPEQRFDDVLAVLMKWLEERS